MYVVVISLLLVGCFEVTGSPYDVVEPGPVIRIGPPGRGTWSVTTVRVSGSDWFGWTVAELTGTPTVRNNGTVAPLPSAAMVQAMSTSQTYASLVAAQLAAGRTPLAGAGLQVTAIARAARGAALRPGDVLLAAEAGGAMTPLRTPSDLSATAVRRTRLRLLIARRTYDGMLGPAEIERLPAATLAAIRATPAVSAVAYPLGDVHGPSAGLLLTLARVDALTSGELTGGRTVAGTGTVNLVGTVGTVGDVGQKVRAAVAAHADVFLVPVLQRAAAVRAVRGAGTRIVPVGSVADAVRWLCATGGYSAIC